MRMLDNMSCFGSSFFVNSKLFFEKIML